MSRGLFILVGAVFLWIAVGAAVFTFQKCGAKALLLGNGGLAAAATGMCDQ